MSEQRDVRRDIGEVVEPPAPGDWVLLEGADHVGDDCD